ncbi:hypothetical protein T440DRAFT_479718 [Plenodomus tracheiphilus IPT5]|uniref:Uncharacterized protein n=1 Tax=Plenodomus tracheiphilus IPT5 TaxID=1408161 RepID=A0A6A7B5G0_9PLEO|nr:hypothetical protein T440DRAFT_479718 [Plenodomus tracheiphilus IPT5]
MRSTITFTIFLGLVALVTAKPVSLDAPHPPTTVSPSKEVSDMSKNQEGFLKLWNSIFKKLKEGKGSPTPVTVEEEHVVEEPVVKEDQHAAGPIRVHSRQFL